jgi:RNA-splicing ligase RtcB
MNVKTFGPVDDRSLKQLERCMAAGDAEYGVLCADHHPGYSQPIGGAIAYEGYVSPSGVGYDIGCVAAGERVLCADGQNRAIELTREPLCADEQGMVRRVSPFNGVVDRGEKWTVRVSLANGREVRVTEDHEIRTDGGWVRADALEPGDRVLCPVFIGLPAEPCELAPALLRIAGYANGDGHLSARASRVCIYTIRDEDVVDLASDFAVLGVAPSIHRRIRPNGSVENAVYVSDPGLYGLLADLGCPVGRKADRWSAATVELLRLPAWARACYVSAFASAEMSTPRLVEQRIANLAIKQCDEDAGEHIGILLDSLGFGVGTGASDGNNLVLQILGGEAEQVRFIEEVGFARAAHKRVAAAATVAVSWERHLHVATRADAQRRVRERMASGERVRDAVARVASASGPTAATVLHLAYRGGPLRPGPGWSRTANSLGESAYSPVLRVEDAGEVETYDVVTEDPAEAFIAGGIAQHNCGNKAVCTELTREDLDALGGVDLIMREITQRVSFGIGGPCARAGRAPRAGAIRTAKFAPQRKLAGLAESQLGTVGSGNHYVNLMEDEHGHVWVGVHFGSRGFGHKTASGFLALAQGLAFDERAVEGEMDSPPVLLEVGTELGDAYIEAMQLAGQYAYAGRDVVVGKVLEILSADATNEVHNHHASRGGKNTSEAPTG